MLPYISPFKELVAHMDPFLLPLRSTTKFHSQWTFLIPGFALLLEEGIALPGVHVDDLGHGFKAQTKTLVVYYALLSIPQTMESPIQSKYSIPFFFPTGKEFPKEGRGNRDGAGLHHEVHCELVEARLGCRMQHVHDLRAQKGLGPSFSREFRL